MSDEIALVVLKAENGKEVCLTVRYGLLPTLAEIIAASDTIVGFAVEL